MPLLERSEKVDSCLTVLKSIDTTALTRPADKARWSLLYAMALDKKYIDTTDLSVLQPAIDRYTHWTHLSRLDKFYTWYYKGRIEENAKIYDVSLDSYLHAERYMRATDDTYRTRLYFGFERVYMKTLSFKKGGEAAKRALLFAKKSGGIDYISTAYADYIAYLINRDNVLEAENYLNEYEGWFNEIAIPYKSNYYCVKMLFYSMKENRNADSTTYYLHKYINNADNASPLSCAIACVAIDQYEQAEQFLDYYEQTYLDNSEFNYSYYYCRSKIFEAKGDFEKALKSVRKQTLLTDRDYMYNLDEEITYLSERYYSLIARMRLIIISMLFVFISIIILFVLIVYLKKKKYELNILRQNYSDISREYKTIKEKQDVKRVRSKKDNIMSLQDRLITIGNSICGRDDCTIMQAAECLSKRSEPKEFEGLVAMLGTIHCYNYVQVLSSYGLTVFEVAYCILGLKLSTKELEYLFKRKNLYNVNTFIKEKLSVTDKARMQRILMDLYYSANSC